MRTYNQTITDLNTLSSDRLDQLTDSDTVAYIGRDEVIDNIATAMLWSEEIIDDRLQYAVYNSVGNFSVCVYTADNFEECAEYVERMVLIEGCEAQDRGDEPDEDLYLSYYDISDQHQHFKEVTVTVNTATADKFDELLPDELAFMDITPLTSGWYKLDIQFNRAQEGKIKSLILNECQSYTEREV